MKKRLDVLVCEQNPEYTKTSEMVRLIGEATGHRIRVSRFLNPAVTIASHMPGKIGKLVNKAFGNLSYDKTISEYDFEYQIVDLQTSIERTEGNETSTVPGQS